MNITVSTVISAIKRHLSIIGKRLYNKEGKNMFSDITLSSAEDTQILTQYINASAQDVEAALKQFITLSTYNGTTISMTITNTRGDADFQERAQDLIQSYITLNSVGEYLSMLHPDIAEKYHKNASQRMDALMMYVIYKNPPTAATCNYPTDITVDSDSIDIGVGEEYIIKYTIPDNCIDDIEILTEDDVVVDAGRTEKGLMVVGKLLGHTYVTIYSRHNKSVSATVHVYVTDQY